MGEHCGMRIGVGGFQHETNTFAPTPARFEDFARAGGWPPLSRGAALAPAVAGINLPVAGFLEAAEAAGHRAAPLLWAAAEPSARVERDAFERIVSMLLDDIAAAGPLDALYLDLHGAMVCEHLEDGEGALLARVREAVGAIPLVASLDLHANVTADMVAAADALVAYRAYPHTDMAETGARALAPLERMAAGARPARAFRKLDFLPPLPWQCTNIEPAASLYARLATPPPGVWTWSICMGFPPADIHEVGPSVLAYADTQRGAEEAADSLAAAVSGAEGDFAGPVFAPAEAAARAMRVRGGPAIIADTQDNPGGGGDSNTLGLLRALIDARAPNAVLGVFCDPETAAAAHNAGVGARLRVSLGADPGWKGEPPLAADAAVRALGDGRFTATGPMFAGARMALGPMALLDVEGIEVVVSSVKMQAADRSIFRHVGVEPAARAIVALKSSAHFRADFAPIAAEIIIAAAPGPVPVDHRALDYRRIRPGVRVMPRPA